MEEKIKIIFALTLLFRVFTSCISTILILFFLIVRKHKLMMENTESTIFKIPDAFFSRQS